MKGRGTGVSIAPDDAVAKPDLLKGKLDKAQALGFDTVELPVHGMRVIVNGRLDEKRLDGYARLLSRYPFRYAMHAPFSINLFDSEEGTEHFTLLLQSIRVCGAIGADTLVYHPGRYVAEEQLPYKDAWPRLTGEDKARLLERERDFMRRAGDAAGKVDVRIGMENMRPYLDCGDYCYSTDPALLAGQLERIAHPQIGITLDVGHLHLAMKSLPYGLEEALSSIRPYIMHMHLHDNFGKPTFSLEKNQYDLLPVGRGDMHMPIGLGDVPMDRIARLLGGEIDGYLIHELRPMYEDEWPKLAERLREATFGAAVRRPPIELAGNAGGA
ncbi:sugar phosphate isomerase/epimerase family protein [Cohnella zeiphila]|uniref:Sugar phosphate isomerase/epimerase n=1 Tax=Cohnella zeiphila TaxID=2761120 RepID=A0A7X0SUE8_9BACL|nr:sugar phosphate isomerase/epimerase [Cohnella zeiphila]MBB6735105.1 sugar phosphate isomerase/epimerase [Cohnella zeiphila]